MILSDIDSTPDDTRQLTHDSDMLIMALSSEDPISRILKLYDQAKDKNVFVAAMAGTLLLRHRQWQVGNSRLPRNQEKILEIFSCYDFRDQLGHPLLNCVDFLQLVESYCAHNTKGDVN